MTLIRERVFGLRQRQPSCNHGGMQYLSSSCAPHTPETFHLEMDAHLKNWADAGWELVSANTQTSLLGDKLQYQTYFIWKKDDRVG